MSAFWEHRLAPWSHLGQKHHCLSHGNHQGSGSLWVNPGASVNSKLRRQFWPVKVVHPSGRPSPAAVNEAGLLHSACWGSVQENSLQLPIMFHFFLLQLHPSAVHSTPKKPGLNLDDSFQTAQSWEDVITVETLQP